MTVQPAWHPTPDQSVARRNTLADLLRRTAAREPDKLGLVFGAVRQTFAELDATVNRAANALAARGIRRGDRVLMVAHNSHGFVVAYFALARLGAVSVPVNFMLGPDEIAYVIRHSGAVAVIAEDALADTADRAWQAADTAPALRVAIGSGAAAVPEGWLDFEAAYREAPAEEPDSAVTDDDPVQIMYTSGTESRPKGAVMSTRNLTAQYTSAIVSGGMSADDIEVHALPLYHCAQLHCFLTPDIQLGATSVVLPGADPAAILRTVEDEHATKLFCPPTVWIALLRHPDIDARDLSTLRKGYYGAAAMPVEILAELHRRLPDLRLYNFYGQTEMSPVATVLGPEDQERKPGSAGRAALNVETRVVDEDGREVPRGEVGEIVHRGPHTMLGYWNDPERTAEAFRGGWFHSGDLGVMDDEGYLRVVDRKKDMIKTGGENVASREVEETVYQHPAVAEVAVFGVPDPYWIEMVCAAVVVKPGEHLAPDDVVAFCRARLAGFKTPKKVVIVAALPKNPSGKVLKRELRALHGG
ncbi:fatty acyl-CoA synthetase [Catenulispora pinisilvae]|uniref:fatty acyl-CoA synthetase n=1 Tax=Catenulispora pinisilvae TaxID=2705253 RepID=UPI00189277D7|nr:fatty acyl-CoA synthetase [Catenulispora pinisilvae]